MQFNSRISKLQDAVYSLIFCHQIMNTWSIFYFFKQKFCSPYITVRQDHTAVIKSGTLDNFNIWWEKVTMCTCQYTLYSFAGEQIHFFFLNTWLCMTNVSLFEKNTFDNCTQTNLISNLTKKRKCLLIFNIMPPEKQ